MPAHSCQIEVATRGKGLYPFTHDVERWLREICTPPKVPPNGLLTVFIQHTSASLAIQENADSDVVLDLTDFFERLVPENDPRYRHVMEGPDDMPSHIRAALTHTSLSIPVIHGRMALGTWQGIYLFEHRTSAMRRSVILQLVF